MGTPKIKVYQLKNGYTMAGDNDVQSVTNDELLPIVDKKLLTEDAYQLKGVEKFENQNLFVLGALKEDFVLTKDDGSTANNTDAIQYIYEGGGLLLFSPNFTPILHQSDDVLIPSDNYILDYDNSSIEFDNGIYSGVFPFGVKITFYEKNTSEGQKYIAHTLTKNNGVAAEDTDQEQFAFDSAVVQISNYITPILVTSTDEIIPTENYTVEGSSGKIVFNNAIYTDTYPIGVKLTFYKTSTVISTNWITQYPLYSGENYMFYEQIDETGSILANTGNDTPDYTIDRTTNIITSLIVRTDLTIDYYAENLSAKIFVSDHPNWVLNHLRTNPDVYLGLYDYPGDDSEDGSGGTIVPGMIPQFIEDGFQIDYRLGTVTFPDIVDTHGVIPDGEGGFLVEYYVKASYAYHIGIKNVSGQVMEKISNLNGYTYQAVNETIWPNSHDKRWIINNTYLMPRFFEIDGEMVPKIKTTVPYVNLTSWQTTELEKDTVLDVSDLKRRSVLFKSNTTNDTATVRFKTRDVTVKFNGSELIWDDGGTTQVLLDELDKTITETYDYVQVRVTLNTKKSFMLDEFVEVS